MTYRSKEYWKNKLIKGYKITQTDWNDLIDSGYDPIFDVENDIIQIQLDIEDLNNDVANLQIGIDANTYEITQLKNAQITGIEVYTTFADLPATGVLLTSYKVSNDSDSSKNGYYHWNGSQYVKDASLYLNVVDENNTSDAITSKAVVDYFVKGHESKNLFDKENITEGKYILSDGTIGTNPDYGLTDYIDVDPNTSYVVINRFGGCYFDATQTYIESFADGGTSPATAAFVRFSFLLTDIDSVQLEAGEISTNYVTNGNKIKETDIKQDGTLTGYEETYNIFVRDSYTPERYINSSTGALVFNGSFGTSDYIKVTGNTYYYALNNFGGAYYDSSKNYIQGFVSGTVSPATAAYIRISFYLINIDNFMVVQSQSLPPYVQGRYLLPESLIKPDGTKFTTYNYITVDVAGNGFISIQDAIDSVVNANSGNITILEIEEGTYNETITTKDYVWLRGENANKCIIDYIAADPLNFDNESTIFATSYTKIENLTIKATNAKYPIHSDAGNTNAPYLLEVDKCILIHLGTTDSSQQSGTAFGIGLHQKQHIKITNSKLVSYNELVGYGSAGIYCHNWGWSGAGYRSLHVENCVLNNCGYGVRLGVVEHASSTDQVNDCYLINNTINSSGDQFFIDSIEPYYWRVFAKGNNIRGVYNPNNTTYILEEDGFTKIGMIASTTIVKGDVINIVGSNLGAISKNSTADNIKIYGVALEGGTTGDFIICQISGKIDVLNISESVNNGDYLKTDALGSVAVASNLDASIIAIALETVASGSVKALLLNSKFF